MGNLQQCLRVDSNLLSRRVHCDAACEAGGTGSGATGRDNHRARSGAGARASTACRAGGTCSRSRDATHAAASGAARPAAATTADARATRSTGTAAGSTRATHRRRGRSGCSDTGTARRERGGRLGLSYVPAKTRTLPVDESGAKAETARRCQPEDFAVTRRDRQHRDHQQFRVANSRSGSPINCPEFRLWLAW